jgi:hypothetical protein
VLLEDAKQKEEQGEGCWSEGEVPGDVAMAHKPLPISSWAVALSQRGCPWVSLRLIPGEQ